MRRAAASLVLLFHSLKSGQVIGIILGRLCATYQSNKVSGTSSHALHTLSRGGQLMGGLKELQVHWYKNTKYVTDASEKPRRNICVAPRARRAALQSESKCGSRGRVSYRSS